MCGIAGFFHPENDYTTSENLYRAILGNMNQTLSHRGPDENGIMLTKRCGLAHTRLSIIDLDTGSQPMTKEYSGHMFHVIFNGEIYNYKELKEELISLNHTFLTSSDTEVILECYLEYGPDFVKKLDGIYSFAIYNSRHETIYLYRDPFGIKPLFYGLFNDTLVFASEIKAIFCFPGITPKVSADGLNEIFALGPARSPGNAVFVDIKELKPGHYLIYNRFGLRDSTYFFLHSGPHTDGYEATVEKTRNLLSDAIRRQMVSDVEICTFLSGGIDSSLVSSILASELQKQGKTLHTFSFDFTGNDEYFSPNAFQPSRDRTYVDEMVRYLGSCHHYLECSTLQQADLLQESVRAHDLPCMADIDASLLFFCKQVGKTHKVVLTGECADEIFGGYPWFHKESLLHARTFPWTPDLSPRKMLLDKALTEKLRMDEYVQDAYRLCVAETEILPWENETETGRRHIAYLNIRYFMQTLLNRMDRTSMHCGLEARVPFADKQLLSYVFNVPWEMKSRDGTVKHLLRQAARPFLPESILSRQKSPYPKTYHPTYEKLLVDRFRDEITPSSPLYPLLDHKAVEAFLDAPKDYGRPWYGQLMAGPQMIAYLLQIHFWLCEYHVSVNIPG
ncbi:MAG: asparagine synthase (glutamine-hydrolyzing) [Lachnospiraceae bacterium]|nr:asparagine synthase (glutamine-hydrolyzing) [Lachnospiraceae bacterium]